MIFSPAEMGRLNKRALLRRLQKTGQASRASLAKLLGMSQPTAGKIVDELLALGVLEEVPPSPAGAGTRPGGNPSGLGPGRPGRLLQLDQTHPRFLAVQLGITETQLAALPLGGAGEDRWPVHFATPKNHAQAAAQWLRQLKSAAGRLRQKNFWGVLVSVPGIVDTSANRLVFSPNLHWTESMDISSLIRKIWDVPVLLVQEEQALALGHQLANPGSEDFLLVEFGDGVGGAIMVQGKLYAGPLPINGELGHTPVPGNRRQCGCGAVGCVETLVSTRGLLESFAAARPRGNHTWPALIQHINENGVTPWLARTLEVTAGTIAGALNVLGLRRVIITGSLTELPPAALAHLSRAVQDGAMWARFGKVECSAAPRCRAAGLVAAGVDRLVFPHSSAEL